MKYPTHKSQDGALHWATDPSDCDTHQACDLMGKGLGIDCPECLGGIIVQLHSELEAARHELAQGDPQGWQCLPDCSLCREDLSYFL